MYGVMDGVNRDFYPGASYEGATVQTYLNGVRLRYGVDYTQDDEKVTFAQAPLPGDSLEFEYLKENVGEGEEHQFEPGETLSGAIDGANDLFVIATGRMFEKVTTRLFQNGLRLKLTEDYSEVGRRTVQLTAAPAVGDDLKIDYIKYVMENWPMAFHDPESSGTMVEPFTELNSASLKWVSGPPQDLGDIAYPRMWPLIHQDGVLYAVRITDTSSHCRLEALDPDDGTLLWSFDLPGTYHKLYRYRFTKTLTYGDGKVFIGGMWEDPDDYIIAIDVTTHLEVWKKTAVYGAQKYDEESGYLYVLDADWKHFLALDPSDGSTVMTSETIAGLDYFPYQCCIAHGRLYVGGSSPTDGAALDFQATLYAFGIGDNLSLDWSVAGSTKGFPVGQFADEDYVYFVYQDYESPYHIWIKKISPAGAVQWTGDGPGFVGSYWGELVVCGQTKDYAFILPYFEATAKVFRKSDGDLTEFAFGSITDTPNQRWGSCNEDYMLLGERTPGITYDVVCCKYDGTRMWTYRWPTYEAGDREMVWGPIITMLEYVLYQCRDGRIFCVETS